MPQKPLHDMKDLGYDNMGEEPGYILHLLKSTMKPLYVLLEKKSSKEDILEVKKYLESLIEKCVTKEQFLITDFSKYQTKEEAINCLREIQESAILPEDFQSLYALVEKHLTLHKDNDFIGAMNIMSQQISTKAIKSVAVEAEDATDLASALTLVNELKAKLDAMNA